MRYLLLLLFFVGCSNIQAPEQSDLQLPEKSNLQVPKQSSIGEEIYKDRCVACHGENGEKLALGKSEAIGGWDKEKTEKVFEGYLNNTYGKELKALMKMQIGHMSKERLVQLAEYISTLSGKE
jgi:mono/diheme cytochrome c family protein